MNYKRIKNQQRIILFEYYIKIEKYQEKNLKFGFSARSVISRSGSAEPDPDLNETDPRH